MIYTTNTASISKTVVIFTKVRLLKILWLVNSCFSWSTRTQAQISNAITKVENTSPVSAKAARLAWFCSLFIAASNFARTLHTSPATRKIKTKGTKIPKVRETVTVRSSYSISCSPSHTAAPSESSSILMSAGLLALAQVFNCMCVEVIEQRLYSGKFQGVHFKDVSILTYNKFVE